MGSFSDIKPRNKQRVMSSATFMVLVKARGVRCPGTHGSDNKAAGRMESKNRNQLASQGRCQHRRGSQEQGVEDKTARDLVSSSLCRGRSGGNQAQLGPMGASRTSVHLTEE